MNRFQKESFTNENIKKAVDRISVFLESNSIERDDIIKCTILSEQLLFLYKDSSSKSFGLKLSRKKNNISVVIFTDGEKRNLLLPGRDIIVDNIISRSEEIPVWDWKNRQNVITFNYSIRLPAVLSLKFMMPYLRKSRRELSAAFISQILVIVFNIIIPLLTARLITAYTDSEAIRIIYIALALSAAGIISYFLDHFSAISFAKVYNSLLNELETDLSRRFFRLEDRCVNDHGSGLFIQRMVNDTENVANGFGNVTKTLAFLVGIMGVIIAVCTISVPVALYMSGVIAFTTFLELRRTKKREQDDRVSRNKKDYYTSFISEMIHGSRDIKLQNSNEVFIDKMSAAICDSNYSSLQLEEHSSRRLLFRKSIKEISDFILLSGLAVLIAKGRILPSAAIIIFNYNLKAADFGFYFGEFLNYLDSLSVSWERISHVLYGREFTEEKFGTLCPDTFTGSVSVKNIDFTYGKINGGSKKVLDGLSFDIKPGEKTALVGKSGSGKTTVFNLLTGLYRPQSGIIELSGIDLSKLSEAYVRGNISVVSQQPYIFNLTVRENLNLSGKDITDEDIEKACRAARIYDDIMAMPKKFDTKLGEGGILLSGGQRQRLAIARCLLRGSRLILLDEATSALDNITQEEVIANLGSVFKDCTVITAAHRLSTVKQSDRVLFLQNGRITAMGTHDELIHTCAEYAELYETEK